MKLAPEQYRTLEPPPSNTAHYTAFQVFNYKQPCLLKYYYYYYYPSVVILFDRTSAEFKANQLLISTKMEIYKFMFHNSK